MDNKENSNNGIIKHGYQPSGNTGSVIGGYQPAGDSTNEGSNNSNVAIPPRGGSAQQDD